jgi:hypothetical protein
MSSVLPAIIRDPYYAQSNDPRDVYRHHFNISQERQQARLAEDAILQGGSWSQPSWSGWKPIIGAGQSDFLQRYAQDGDSGFFHSRMMGCGNPIGMNPTPPNNLINDYSGVSHSTRMPTVSTLHPTIVEPSARPDESDLQLEANFTPEPQQRAVYAPPFSQTQMQGLGKAVNDEDNVLYQEPFEIPKYKGGLHKKGLFGRKQK